MANQNDVVCASRPTGMLTHEQREEARQARLGEVGTLSPCPFCRTPRVQRSDYIRCNPCGINWLDEEMHLPDYLNRSPAACRVEESGRRRASASTGIKTASSAERTTAAAN